MITATLVFLAFAPQAKAPGASVAPVRQLFANITFDKFDGDKDGFIVASELAKGSFVWLDKNKDKFLDREELKKMPVESEPLEKGREGENKEKGKEKGKEKNKSVISGDETTKKPGDKKDDPQPNDAASKYLQMMDTNNDSKLSPDEFRIPEGWLDQADLNSDQKISKEEFNSKEVKSKTGDASNDKDKKGAFGDWKTKIAKYGNMSPDEAVKDLDADADGKISASEWPFPQGFELADQDSDGTLNKEEVGSAIDRLKEMMKGKVPKGGDKGKGSDNSKEKGGSGTDAKKPAPKPEPKPGEEPPM
ncbi:MAG: hypothetical protein ACKVS6_16565 [Planctomycetota bacterium]